LPTLLDSIGALADPLRARVVLALEDNELTVWELSAVFQLPQSTMSRHLKVLSESGWLAVRADGATRRYSMPGSAMSDELRRVWGVVRDGVRGDTAVTRDRERIESVLAERRSRRREFFSGAAAEWDRLRRELIGRRLDAVALLGLLDPRLRVGDLGCGTGQVTEALAPFVGSIVAVDESPEMLQAARERLSRFAAVEVRHGELENLPLADDEIDAAVIFLALQYVATPVTVVREAARVVRPGGRVLIVDLSEHDREEYRQSFGHHSLGFSAEQIQGWLADAGFGDIRHIALPPDPEAKGPPIFVASATA